MSWDFPFFPPLLFFLSAYPSHANCLNVTNQPRMHEIPEDWNKRNRTDENQNPRQGLKKLRGI